MKLSSRFFLSHAIVGIATLFISMGLLFAGSHWMVKNEKLQRQKQLLENLRHSAREAGTSGEIQGIVDYLKNITASPEIIYAVVHDSGSRLKLVYPLLWQEESNLLLPPELFHPTVPLVKVLGNGQRVLEWSSPLIDGDEALGFVKLAWSEYELNNYYYTQLRSWTLLAGIAVAASLFFGVLIAWLLGKSLLAPIAQIVQKTRDVRRGRLDGLVEVNRQDEIGVLAREFNQMTVELKELDEMKRDFTSGVTHDLGTPLYAIRSAISFLQEGGAGRVSRRQAEYLLVISNAAENLSSFIQNMLTLARIEAGKAETYLEEFDPAGELEPWLKLYKAQAVEKGLKLVWKNESEGVRLVADITQFRQIFLNLISNALKFTEKGTIIVNLKLKNSDLILSVSDTGIGIDPRYHQLVFDRFYRVRQQENGPARQGSGLGLSIVRGLLLNHSGRMELRSELGKGAEFRVYFPRKTGFVPNLRNRRKM